ncbi:hypothetical protein BaRGS_00033446 [Batillaria attramentaria]|uniref:Alpha-galactosidase n=1 Tax=Batillaria attramentaria TaxID=370345 RepID=A0ABD0JKE6_9CAEN
MPYVGCRKHAHVGSTTCDLLFARSKIMCQNMKPNTAVELSCIQTRKVMMRQIAYRILQFVAAWLMIQRCHALDNGLARTPPMGWLSWERFRCHTDCKNRPSECISEKLYMDMADRLVADGYRDAGYTYVNVDDCWSSLERDSNGRLQADPDRFPSGIKFLADYMHKRGLKLGIYGDMGTKTCGGYPGSKFYMQADAELFAEWGIDSFKMDGCFSDPEEFPISYPIMSQWLNKTGRPILFSCSWPTYLYGRHPNYTAVAESCNIWRNYRDIEESWDVVKDIIEFFGNDSDNFSSVARPGAFNDPDMDGDIQIWARPISPVGSYAVAFLNFGIKTGRSVEVTTSLAKLGLHRSSGYNVTEGFTGQKIGIYKPGSSLTVFVNPSGVYLIVARPLQK